MDVSNKADTLIRAYQYSVPKIAAGDILYININTVDQMGALPQDQGAASSGMGASGAAAATAVPSDQTNLLTRATSYEVDRDGKIDLPVVGELSVADSTLYDARALIRKSYARYYKDFTVNISFVNHKITILGEVNRPGTYDIVGDKITILDALGMAGDITVFGKKENVLLIRNTPDGQKHLVRLDMSSRNIMLSPYYYIQSNDMLYIEAKKSKLASTDVYLTRNIAIITGVLTVLAIVFSRVH